MKHQADSLTQNTVVKSATDHITDRPQYTEESVDTTLNQSPAQLQQTAEQAVYILKRASSPQDSIAEDDVQFEPKSFAPKLWDMPFGCDSVAYGESRPGVTGDPVPYTIRRDDTVTSLLLACFILALISFARSRDFIFRQAKEFFVVRHSGPATEVTETTSEFRFQFFLAGQTCLLASIVTFLYTLERIADTFILKSQHLLIWIFFGCYVGYFLLKSALYATVNGVFFDAKQNRRWQKSLLFIICVEGVLLFPLVMLQAYFNLSMKNAVIYAYIVVLLTKLLTFYKIYVIFFGEKRAFLQIILYFCTLEIVPLFSLGGILVAIVDLLKLNF